MPVERHYEVVRIRKRKVIWVGCKVAVAVYILKWLTFVAERI